MLRVFQQLQTLNYNWRIICSIIRILHHIHELNQLLRWAWKKRLLGPVRAYKSLLLDMEVTLNRYMLQHPKLIRLARVLYWVNCIVTPAPRYYKRGSAAKYRFSQYRRQTTRAKKTR